MYDDMQVLTRKQEVQVTPYTVGTVYEGVGYSNIFEHPIDRVTDKIMTAPPVGFNEPNPTTYNVKEWLPYQPTIVGVAHIDTVKTVKGADCK